MNTIPLEIVGTGLVTGVGLNGPSSCAAIRCAIDNFQESRFVDSGGEWIMASEVLLEQPWRGKTKLIRMAGRAVEECLDEEGGIRTEKVPLLLCLPESERAGRVIDDDNRFFHDLCEELGRKFHEKSRVIAQGHVGFATALLRARSLIQDGIASQVLIVGVDGYLVGSTLTYYEKKERLLTSSNSNGFVPGEAASAVLVRGAGNIAESKLICSGLGFGVEKATVESDEPLRAEGLVQAYKAALKEADCDVGDLDFRITDVSGEQYHFKEASLALGRTLRTRKEEFDIWHPADCIGEVGAAMGGVMAVVIDAACRKSYIKGEKILLHLGNDDGKRVAMVFHYQSRTEQA